MCAILKKSVDEESTLGTVLQRSLPDMFLCRLEGDRHGLWRTWLPSSALSRRLAG